jgi:hypothetical protein
MRKRRTIARRVHGPERHGADDGHGDASDDDAAEPEMVNRAGLDAPRQADVESHMASW